MDDPRTYYNQGVDWIILGGIRPDGTPDIADVKHVLPVPHRQLRIGRKIELASDNRQSGSGKLKQAKGSGDAEIAVTLTLYNKRNGKEIIWSALDQAKALHAAFYALGAPIGKKDAEKAASGKKTLPVYSISSKLIDVFDVKTVLFTGFDINDNPGTSKCDVNLSFIEFEPPRAELDNRRAAQIRKAEHAALEDALGMSLSEDDVASMEMMSYDPSEDPDAVQASFAVDAEVGREDSYSKGFRAAKAFLGGEQQ